MKADGFVDHCLELLAPLGAPRARRMFGGHGLYLDELFIGIVADERLFLKADAGAAARFADAGSQPFSFLRAGQPAVVMGFWAAPAEAMESPALMQPWARLALQAALAAKAAKVTKPRQRAPLKKSAKPGRASEAPMKATKPAKPAKPPKAEDAAAHPPARRARKTSPRG